MLLDGNETPEDATDAVRWKRGSEDATDAAVTLNEGRLGRRVNPPPSGNDTAIGFYATEERCD